MSTERSAMRLTSDGRMKTERLVLGSGGIGPQALWGPIEVVGHGLERLDVDVRESAGRSQGAGDVVMSVGRA